MSHELALQKGLIARLKADATVAALVGDRIWDHPPTDVAFPHVRLGRAEVRPLPGGGEALEQRLSLIVVSRFAGTEEARAIAAAIRVCLVGAEIEADGVRSLGLEVPVSEVLAADDRTTTWAVIRVRTVTQDI